MPLRYRPLLALIALLLGGVARAQIVFTFHGTVDDDCAVLGYASNQAVTFTLTTNSGFGVNSSGFGEGSNHWAEELLTDQPLFVSLTGTGLTGSLTRPSANNEDPFSVLQTTGATNLYFLVSADSGTGQDIGLTAPSDALVHQFSVTIDATGVAGLNNFTVLSGYSDPIAFFAAHAGTYSGFASSDITLTDINGNMLEASVDSLTISAIPEPSTTAALAGVAVFGLVFIRRRFAKSA